MQTTKLTLALFGLLTLPLVGASAAPTVAFLTPGPLTTPSVI